MRKDVEKFVGAAMLGVVCTIGYQLIKNGVQMVKNKQALKGIAEELGDIDQMVKEAEKVNS